MLIDVIRKVIPNGVRKPIGMTAWRAIRGLPPLGIFYVYSMYGILVKPAGDRQFVAGYEGMKLLFPWSEWDMFYDVILDDVYEQPFHVRADDIVIDIGASVGLFTLKAAREVGSEGQVIAIEPEPENLTLLRCNMDSNGLTNVVNIIGKACGSHRATVPLYLHTGWGGHSLYEASASSIEVRMDSLDNIVSELALDRVDFIKIDAEGAELDILKGAEKTLSLPNVKLAIAAYHMLPDGSPEFPRIVSWLKQRGFETQTRNEEYIYAAKHKEAQSDAQLKP